jgi:hypothetical protein
LIGLPREANRWTLPLHATSKQSVDFITSALGLYFVLQAWTGPTLSA